jgi:bla regulator protein BlaR1
MERLLFEFVLRATLIAVVAGVALWALRIRSASARHAVWASVILAMLVLPEWMLWGPKARLAVLPARHAAVTSTVIGGATPRAIIHPVQTSAPAPARRTRWRGDDLFAAVYLLGAAVLLLRLAIGTIRANGLTSRAVSAPVTVGLLRPRIILPESSRDWTQNQLNAVMVHEREHVRRRDPLFRCLALLNRALFWFNPVAWWLELKISALAEEACDAAVIEHGHAPREYSLFLLEMARAVVRSGARVNVAVVAMAMPGSYLSRRIRTIVSGARAPRISRTRAICTALVVAIPSALVASGTLDRARHTLPALAIRAKEIPLPPVLLAQAQTGAAAPTPAPMPEFEVASVRPSNPDQSYLNSATPSLRVGGDQYLRFIQITLRDLIMLAYGIGSGQVQGPGFLRGSPDNPADRFDIAAKVPEGATPGQVPLMLRALLAERFHLSFHRQNKPMDVYALEVAKAGPKMKDSREDATGAAHCVRSVAEREQLTLTATCSRMTAADVAQQVQALAPGYFRDGPVVDLTGLKGTYDFTLEWITAGQANQGAPGPSMFEAVQEQLGLKLERRKQTVEIMVIDKLDRTPTEN